MDERRREPRRSARHIRARVRLTDRRQFERCYLKDLSQGGIFLRSADPSPLDAKVEITMELPDLSEIQLHGTVVHRTTSEEVTEGRAAGFGVAFDDLTPEVRGRLEALLDELPIPKRSANDDEEQQAPTARRARVAVPPAAAPARNATTAPAEPRLRVGTPRRGAPAAGVVAAPVGFEILRRLLWRLADVRQIAHESYYTIIGVKPSASAIEIRAACEALRRALDLEHPPAGLEGDEIERITAVVGLIDRIEQRLCDPTERTVYDRAHLP